MLKLGQIKSTALNLDALKPKKPGIPRIASQRLKPIDEKVILPINTKQSRQGYFPMMITSKVDAEGSAECEEVPICSEVELARKQAMHRAIKQNVDHLLRCNTRTVSQKHFDGNLKLHEKLVIMGCNQVVPSETRFKEVSSPSPLRKRDSSSTIQLSPLISRNRRVSTFSLGLSK